MTLAFILLVAAAAVIDLACEFFVNGVEWVGHRFGVARTAVYSLHKSSTRAYLERHALHVLRAASATVLAELRYELPRVYAHHRKDAVTIEVDLWRFEPPADGVVGGSYGGEGAEGAEGADDADAAEVDVRGGGGGAPRVVIR